MVIRTAKNMEMKHYGQKYCEEEEEGIELVTSRVFNTFFLDRWAPYCSVGVMCESAHWYEVGDRHYAI